MENIRLGIDCCDAGYAQTLARALTALSLPLTIVLYGEEAQNTSSGAAPQTGCDVLLTDRRMVTAAPQVILEERIRGADEENPHALKNDAASPVRHWAYKYGSLRAMAAAAMEAYAEKSGRLVRLRHEGEALCIGLVSSAGGSGCTTLAMALAQCLVKYYEQRILFMTLDEFPPQMQSPAPAGRRMRDFLYYLQAKRREKYGTLAPFIHQDEYGVLHFHEEAGGNTLARCSEDALRQIIEAAAAYGGVDLILLDIGAAPSWRQAAALACCSSVIRLQGEKDAAYERAMRKYAALTFDKEILVEAGSIVRRESAEEQSDQAAETAAEELARELFNIPLT
ncbi:MAG: hypothetical protein PUC26_04890 [Eubacteriales bacterium]|jgi:hypothetical protein|nr:hypothetical protein [Eubacteriales bacterium]